MIEELAHIEGIALSSVDTAALQAYLEELETRRNLVKHALWLKGPKQTYLVQNLQGSWPKQGDKRVRKRIDPEGIALKPSDLQALSDNIRDAIQAVRRLSAEISTQLKAPAQK